MCKSERTPPGNISEAAQRIWKTFAEQYNMNDAQVIILTEAMKDWDLCEIARKEIKLNGLTIPGDKGTRKNNPACSTLSQQQNSLRQWLQRLDIELSSMIEEDMDFDGDDL